MGPQPEPQPEPQRASFAVARDRLPNGIVVSTVRLPGPRPRFETKVFAAGWGERPDADELETRRATTRSAALQQHRLLVERHRARVDPTDPNWVFRLLGLPPRRAQGEAWPPRHPRPR
ncbi:MAG: hypothetical protein AB7N76_10510 [Planctomycetota bacterium]